MALGFENKLRNSFLDELTPSLQPDHSHSSVFKQSLRAQTLLSFLIFFQRHYAHRIAECLRQQTHTPVFSDLRVVSY